MWGLESGSFFFLILQLLLRLVGSHGRSFFVFFSRFCRIVDVVSFTSLVGLWLCLVSVCIEGLWQCRILFSLSYVCGFLVMSYFVLSFLVVSFFFYLFFISSRVLWVCYCGYEFKDFIFFVWFEYVCVFICFKVDFVLSCFVVVAVVFVFVLVVVVVVLLLQ